MNTPDHADQSRLSAANRIDAIDADVMSTCRGFEYRGQDRHTRDVKAARRAIPYRAICRGD
jgi:hypothetical protein